MSEKYEVPWVLNSGRFEEQDYLDRNDAASKHQKQLSKAEGNIMAAKDFANVLYESFAENDDYLVSTAATVVKELQKRLSKAQRQLDRHGTRDTNLFIAYFDLKGGAL